MALFQCALCDHIEDLTARLEACSVCGNGCVVRFDGKAEAVAIEPGFGAYEASIAGEELRRFLFGCLIVVLLAFALVGVTAVMLEVVGLGEAEAMARCQERASFAACHRAIVG